MDNNHGYSDDNQYSEPQQNSQNYKIKNDGLAIAAFVIAIVNICTFCMFTPILAPISLVLAIVSLAAYRDGKGFAIAGIVISGIAILAVVLFFVFVGMIPVLYPQE